MVNMIRHHHEVFTGNRPHLMKRVVENNVRVQDGAQPTATLSTQLSTSTIILVVVFVIIGLLLVIGKRDAARFLEGREM